MIPVRYDVDEERDAIAGDLSANVAAINWLKMERRQRRLIFCSQENNEGSHLLGWWVNIYF